MGLVRIHAKAIMIAGDMFVNLVDVLRDLGRDQMNVPKTVIVFVFLAVPAKNAVLMVVEEVAESVTAIIAIAVVTAGVFINVPTAIFV
ncbi:MAG: hypothetical protein NC927_00160 [Candidatus Omnitrophica bacterium]|nr:hypothetical protein [Candidatus Omnitrophota bacterium]